MLDASRTFISAEYTKKLIDTMALHKLNVFHWHLTDDQGWRIEIKAYPELTRSGAKYGVAASPGIYACYTQEQIRDIVSYAAERHVSILPEIDVPGHSRAAVVAYPEIRCAGMNQSRSVQGVSGNVWCAGKDRNFVMLDQIVREVKTLFPFKYIHIGGDEVNRNAWKTCLRCQGLMKREGFKNLGNIQNYFIRRMERIVTRHDRQMIGWNEIMHGGNLAKETAIMAWISAAPGYHAARKGHPVVLSPGQFTYFDMKESPRDAFGHWWAGVVPLQRVYAFNPVHPALKLPRDAEKNILGVHACLWTSMYRKTNSPSWSSDYKTWPRLCALSEVAWSPQEERHFEDFKTRLGVHMERLAMLGVSFRVPEASVIVKDDGLHVVPPYGGADVYYTISGKNPSGKSKKWDGTPIALKYAKTLRTCVIAKNGAASHVSSGVARKPDRAKVLKPVATVTSTMPAHRRHKMACIADWNPRSVFRTRRNGKKGDTCTLSFKMPIKLKSVSFITGAIGNVNQNNIIDGSLMISYDGKVFKKVAQFTFGMAKASLDGKPVKAIQAKLNADHDDPLVFQDPILR